MNNSKITIGSVPTFLSLNVNEKASQEEYYVDKCDAAESDVPALAHPIPNHCLKYHHQPLDRSFHKIVRWLRCVRRNFLMYSIATNASLDTPS